MTLSRIAKLLIAGSLALSLPLLGGCVVRHVTYTQPAPENTTTDEGTTPENSTGQGTEGATPDNSSTPENNSPAAPQEETTPDTSTTPKATPAPETPANPQNPGSIQQVDTPTISVSPSQGSGSAALSAFEYEWNVQDSNGRIREAEYDGMCINADGSLPAIVGQVKISGTTQGTITFSESVREVDIERTPLAQTNPPLVNLRSDDWDVPCMFNQSGSVTFTLDPGYLYEVDVDYAQGDAKYAFYTA